MQYNPQNPGAGFGALGVQRSAVKVKFQADENASPGWSGFFDWLSKWHAPMYDYLRVSLPNMVEDSQAYPEAGRHISGLRGWDLDEDTKSRTYFMNGLAPLRVIEGSRYQSVRGYDGGMDPAQSVDFNGFGYLDRVTNHYDPANTLGADSSSINWLTTPASQIVAMNSPLAASEGVTDGASQPTTVTSASIIDTIKQAVPAFLSLSNDQKILNAQLDRATKGLPPLDLSKYTANTGLQFGLNSSTQQTLLLAAGGLAAVFLLSKLLRK